MTESAPSCFAAAQEVTRRMLAAARDGDWDALPALESQRAEAFRQLAEADVARLAETGADAAALIRGLLERNEELRALVQARRDDLSHSLAGIRTERRLQDAYGAGEGA